MASKAIEPKKTRRLKRDPMAPVPRPSPEDVAAQKAHEVSSAALRKLSPKGNTVLKDFGRVLRDEPHKYIYPIKLYLLRNKVPEAAVMDWVRERYISAKGGRNHGARYEVRCYGAEPDAMGRPTKRYVDYMLLEQMTDDERVMFALEFGEVTDQKVVRDGKLRRPRLHKDEKKALDDMINRYYLDIARQRREAAQEMLDRHLVA